jgi:hypothetical protein
MRRLFQECKIAEGNAALLSSALAYAKPEDLRKEITQVTLFRFKRCTSSDVTQGILWEMSIITRPYNCADTLGDGGRRTLSRGKEQKAIRSRDSTR